MRALAQRLIAAEGRHKSPPAVALVLFPDSEKLRPHLSTLMGNFGFRALLSRAHALASTEVRCLRTVQIKSDGSIERKTGSRAVPKPAEILEGRVVLLAQLLGLLVAFIGEELALQLIHDAWPHPPRAAANLNKRAKNEKTK